MRFDPEAVFSEDIKKPEKTKKKLNSGKSLLNLYVVSLRDDFKNPEIYRTLQFRQKNFPTDTLNVIGVFKSEDEALEFIRNLSELALTESGELDFKEGFNKLKGASL